MGDDRGAPFDKLRVTKAVDELRVTSCIPVWKSVRNIA
jgi:hypothetical protein